MHTLQDEPVRHHAVDQSPRPLPLLTGPRDPVAGVRSSLGLDADFDETSLAAMSAELGDLLVTEYTGRRPPESRAGRLAALRHDVRQCVTRSPAELLAMVAEPAVPAAMEGVTRSVVSDAFALTVADGRAEPTTAIKALLPDGDSVLQAFLLDLADEHGLDVMMAAEAHADADRAVLHSLWRYFSGRPEDPGAHGFLAESLSCSEDPYDQLLLTAALRRLGATAAGGHPLWPGPLGRPTTDGITVAQSMLLGLPDQPGAGSSGGLSVLLASLGDALADLPEIARVVTVVLCPVGGLATLDSLAEPAAFLSSWNPGPAREHVLLRVPVDSIEPLAQPGMALHRAAIRWWVRELFTAIGVSPEVIHVRYADDGSLALAEVAAAGDSSLVFTATADPHRAIAARYPRETAGIDEVGLQFDLHRMYLADRLIGLADQVVAIPGRRNDGELLSFFPQLNPEQLTRPVQVIEEGIALYRSQPSDEAAQRQLVASLFAPHSALPRLDDTARGRPLMLCVGRLHPVKQQDLLVEAWLAEQLYEQCSLVLIGGALDSPTNDEAGIFDRILLLAKENPAAAGRLAVLPALGNSGVRMIEHAVQRFLPAPSPHLYVCPSIKEEFGIAVLEAMDSGFLVGGPRRGGLGHYIHDQHNGYLLDTGSAASFAPDLAAFVARAGGSPIAHRMIAEAGRETVRRRFGIHQVAAKFAGVYGRLAVDVAGGPSCPA